MQSKIGKWIVASAYAVLTAAGMYGLHVAKWQQQQAEVEEAIIFNADDAQWFGDDPVVRQPLVLLSIWTEDDGPRARVSLDGQERVVAAGDAVLPPCLRVADIVDNAILLDSCGAFRLLSEGGPQFEYHSGLADYDFAVSASSIVDLRRDERARALIDEYLQRLYESPLSLRGQLDVRRSKTNAGRRQYYLYPGDDPRLFSALPLQGGDRLHAVNGMALAAPNVLNDLYDTLGESPDITLTLERDGKALVVLLSLPPAAAANGQRSP